MTLGDHSHNYEFSAMSEYSSVRVGKLRLKGAAGEGLKGKKKRKRKREHQEEVRVEDLRHGV